MAMAGCARERGTEGQGDSQSWSRSGMHRPWIFTGAQGGGVDYLLLLWLCEAFDGVLQSLNIQNNHARAWTYIHTHTPRYILARVACCEIPNSVAVHAPLRSLLPVPLSREPGAAESSSAMVIIPVVTTSMANGPVDGTVLQVEVKARAKSKRCQDQGKKRGRWRSRAGPAPRRARARARAGAWASTTYCGIARQSGHCLKFGALPDS